MPTEPDNPDAAPPELPCWYGVNFASPPPRAAAPEATPSGTTETGARPRKTTPRDVLGFFALVTGFVALLAALLLSVVSVLAGRGRMIAAIAFVHLPYIALIVRVMYLARKGRAQRRRPPAPPPEDVPQSSLGFMATRKASAQAEGLFWGDDAPTEWSLFTHAEMLSEADACFVVRLHKHPEKLRSVFAPLVESVEHAPDLAQVPRTPKSVLLDIVVVVPPVATVYLAVQGWLAHGWRTDVVAALCLAAFYAVTIPLLFAVRFTQRETVNRLAQQKESVTLDLLFDRHQVPPHEAMTRINGWITDANTAS